MTKDEESLLKGADACIAAAKLLLENGFADFAASRAYYGMFLTAEALLLSKEMSFSKHSAVISAFGREFTKPGLIPADFQKRLMQAQQARLVADYGGGGVISSESAQAYIDHAAELLDHARRYLSGKS